MKYDKCWCECKKHNICDKGYIWNPATCSWYSEDLANIIDDSVITCSEIIEETVATNKVDCKTQNFHILLAFLLITISLLIHVSIYCYMIKHEAKQKHLLPFYVTNNKPIEFCIDNIN